MPRDRFWVVREKMPEEARLIFGNVHATVAQLLWNRGLRTEESAQQFLHPVYEKDLHDPFLFRDMEKAVARLLEAIEKKEKILVHGDYDADGVCASGIMVHTIRLLGGNVDVFLPHREKDGYGLKKENVERFSEEGVAVIVTCDCGIANTKEIAVAKEKGIDVIITDHHAMPEELPAAFATIHPKVPGETYPWDGLAGGGVAFKLAQALFKRKADKVPAGTEKWLLDFVAISSVADMVPLMGETRTMVRFGLVVLQKTRRIGLRKLMEAAGVFDEFGVPKKPIDATTIGFQIAPRINAAGRLDHAKAAFTLLMEDDPAQATIFAAALHLQNVERQKQTERCLNEARAMIKEQGWMQDAAIVVAGDWSPGVVGLVAGRLMDELYRPVFAVSLRENIVGSGRSISGYHIVDAMKTYSSVFEKFGGHPQACGFTVKRDMVDKFREAARAHASLTIQGDGFRPLLEIDTDISLKDVNWDLYEQVKTCEPFGIGNPEPLFLSQGVRISDVQLVGAEGKHARFTVSQGSGDQRKMIAFGFGDRAVNMSPGDHLDVVYTVSMNEWNGRKDLQMKVVDLKTSV